MPAGRPRTSTLEPKEMEKLGEEMIQWVRENDPLHMSAFYSIEKGILEKDWNNMIQAPEFYGYYEIAMRIIGQKYLNKNSNVREGVSQRWQRVYFKDLAKLEDEDARFKAELSRKKEEEDTNDFARKLVEALTDIEGLPRAEKARGSEMET